MLETLNQFITKFEYAQTKKTFVEALNNLKSPTQTDWDKQSNETKSAFDNDFNKYKKAIDDNNIITKNAIRQKLVDRRNMCLTEEKFSAEEKQQYSNEFNDVIPV